jgi:uncharacterized protein involved in oxidation of intracellular sulfur
MKLLIILNKNPYDGSDVTRNALRLAEATLKAGDAVSLFLLNDSVDLAREGVSAGGYDTDLGKMLFELMAKGVTVKVCKSCMARCGLAKNMPLVSGAIESKMPDLAALIKETDKVISF